MPKAFVIVSAVLQVAAFGSLAWKLLRSGLARSYRFLTAFALLEALRVSIAASIPRASDLYAHFYFATQPLLWLMSVLVTIEVYNLVFRSFAGIAGLARVLIPLLLMFAASIALGTLLPERSPDSRFPLLESYLLLDRSVAFSLLLLVILLVAFLAWYPVRMSRNTLVHSVVFCFLFGARAMALLFRTIQGPGAVFLANYILLGASLGAVAWWLLKLTPEGASVPAQAGYRRNQVDEERLLAQLESINRTLLRSARK